MTSQLVLIGGNYNSSTSQIINQLSSQGQSHARNLTDQIMESNNEQRKVDVYNSIEIVKTQPGNKLINSYNNSLDIGNSLIGKDMVKVGSLLPIKSERGVSFNQQQQEV